MKKREKIDKKGKKKRAKLKMTKNWKMGRNLKIGNKRKPI